MSGHDLWSFLGGQFRSFRPASQRVMLDLDPILCAYRVDAARVLQTNRDFRWLSTALGVFSNYDVFMEHVKPDPTAKQATHQTVAAKWLPTLKKLEEWNLLETAASIRMAYASFFIIPKEGAEGGRAIFDLAAFSRLCARPYAVNLPYVPHVLRLIGAWKHGSGFCWAADYRHWWYQNKITDERIRNFFVLECGGQVLRAKVYLMGHSWSAFSGHSCTLGICLGEWPKSLRHLVDWESLKGDTPPAWILLREGEEVIGVLMAYYDNIFLFAKMMNLLQEIRAHILRRSDYCGAQFKVTWCPVCEMTRKKMDFCTTCIGNGLSGQLTVDPVRQECDFLGAVVRYNGERWVWRHRDPGSWPSEIPTEEKRSTYAHYVGILVWDGTIALETIAEVEPALKVLRKVTKGVTQRKDWSVRVRITQEESDTLLTMIVRAKGRGEMFLSEEIPASMDYVYLATDANNTRVAWVHLSKETPVNMPVWIKSVHYDHRLAMIAHIFFKELEAATWGIETFCEVYTGVAIYLALDNSAVYYVLRRMFSGVAMASSMVERITAALKKAKNVLFPVLVPGVHNVADSPTREEPFSLERLGATWHALEAERLGGARKLHSWNEKRPRDMKERMRVEEAPKEILDEQDAFEGVMEDEDG